MTGFNPRTPCGVRRELCQNLMYSQAFQSTHSLRSATSRHKRKNIRKKVSIHALLAECDIRPLFAKEIEAGFNPRTPCGVRPFRHPALPQVREEVSIHALLAECDANAITLNKSKTGFNPRTPCGVRQDSIRHLDGISRFQSTHSLRSATILLSTFSLGYMVSIHALLAECD